MLVPHHVLAVASVGWSASVPRDPTHLTAYKRGLLLAPFSFLPPTSPSIRSFLYDFDVIFSILN
jgi:hypothetical protein